MTAPTPREGARVLIYSHDTFGLGHLRRCRTIAHALVGAYKNLSVLILSGSPIIGSFDFRIRTDFVRIPGVIKLHNGEYTSLGLHMDISDTLQLRERVIQSTAESFRPDIFIVDKEPTGLKGEVAKTLHMLKDRGTGLVLGVRDILDDDAVIAEEWQRKKAIQPLHDLYDALWVYGLPQINRPLDVFHLPDVVEKKIHYTGYLDRSVWSNVVRTDPWSLGCDTPYVLITPGGGGDGEAMVDWVLRTYEACGDVLPHHGMFVLGPFMAADAKADFLARAARLPTVTMIEFDAHLEHLMENAAGVVAMGGYNTFCEILTFDKPALIIPRTRPRMEQFIRASRAMAAGLVRMVEQDPDKDVETMRAALQTLPQQAVPSAAGIQGLLSGRQTVVDLAAPWLGAADRVVGPEE